MEYHGRLSSVDSYMNVKLTNTEEWKDSKNEGSLGDVFIRLCSPFHIYQFADHVDATTFFGSVRLHMMVIECSKISFRVLNMCWIKVRECISFLAA